MRPESLGYYFIFDGCGRREIALYTGLWYRFGRTVPVTSKMLADRGFTLGDLVSQVQSIHSTPEVLELLV